MPGFASPLDDPSRRLKNEAPTNSLRDEGEGYDPTDKLGLAMLSHA